ncbi:MAG TPA: GNAT family N-acetyltransferase [Streptomyces sp.]
MSSLLTVVDLDVPLGLDDGTITHARTAAAEDFPLVDDFHTRCSAASLFARYGRRRPAITSSEWRRMTDGPRTRVLLVTPGTSDRVVAVATMTESPGAPDTCGMGLLVADCPGAAYQSRGLGTRLADLVSELARGMDFTSLVVTPEWTNWRMFLIAEHLGGPALPQTPYVRNMALLGSLPRTGRKTAKKIKLRVTL